MKNELIYQEHIIKVPLDPNDKGSNKIEIFAREVYLPKNKNADIFVFLQGGPGFASPRNLDHAPGLMQIVLSGFRLVLLDHRGTGKSTKIDPQIASEMNSSDLAKYFSHFRATEIVADLEHLREKVFKVKKWFLIGQSYGGFVSFTYLSFYPKSIKGVIVCGGIPPICSNSVDSIYNTIQEEIKKRNQTFYNQYPKDLKVINRIIDILQENPYILPDLGRVTFQRFLDIGSMLGQSNGPKTLHNFIEDPFLDSSQKKLSFEFITKVIRQTSFETNPIYAVLHESCYCNNMISNWSADKMLKAHSTFNNVSKPCFFGETIRKEMFNEYKMLRPYKKAADIISQKKWGALYDLNQLQNNIVPVEAMVYETDYYVNYKLTKRSVDLISNVKTWVHSDWQHDGLRTHGKVIIKKLLNRLIKRLD